MDFNDNVKMAQMGDKEAFIDLINECKQSMYKVTCAMLDSMEDRGDAMQDTILSAFKNLHNLKKAEYFKTWITRILINKCNDIICMKKKVIPVDNFYEQENNSDDFKAIELKEALCRLKSEYRTSLILYHIDDISIKDISKIMNVPEGTVKSWLSRARAELKREYYDSEKERLCNE